MSCGKAYAMMGSEQEEPSGEVGAAGLRLGCNHGPGLGRFARLRAAATCGAERDGAVVEGLKRCFNSGGGGWRDGNA